MSVAVVGRRAADRLHLRVRLRPDPCLFAGLSAYGAGQNERCERSEDRRACRHPRFLLPPSVGIMVGLHSASLGGTNQPAVRHERAQRAEWRLDRRVPACTGDGCATGEPASLMARPLSILATNM